MAAPDFPASPTVGQTYTPSSGLTYRWDGQVWTTTGAPQNAYWTDTGTTLTPTDVTKTFTIPGDAAGNAVVLGTRTVKARMSVNPSQDVLSLLLNHNLTGPAADDPLKPRWLISLDDGNDWFRVSRVPASSGTFNALLTVSSAGNLTPGGFVSAGTAPGTG